MFKKTAQLARDGFPNSDIFFPVAMQWVTNGVPVPRPTLYFSPLWKSTFSQTPKYDWPKIAAETRTLPSNSREACARRLVGPPWYIAQSGLLLRQPALYSCANSYYLPSCYYPVLPSWPVCPCAPCAQQISILALLYCHQTPQPITIQQQCFLSLQNKRIFA